MPDLWSSSSVQELREAVQREMWHQQELLNEAGEGTVPKQDAGVLRGMWEGSVPWGQLTSTALRVRAGGGEREGAAVSKQDTSEQQA